MQKRLIILILGIILSLISIFMVKAYIDQKEHRVKEMAKRELAQIRASQAAVLVAKQDIPQGVPVDPNMLETTIIPNQYIQPQAATSLDRIAGMITIAPISRGEQITLSKLVSPRRGGGNLAALTPVGKRAITISVDNIASLVGMVKPGDYVDIMALIIVPIETPQGRQDSQAVIPLFQNVLVLAVGREMGAFVAQQPSGGAGRYAKPEAPPQEISPLITLALSPQEANLIVFVQEQGRIRLVLRSPADTNIEPVQPASWDTLFQYILPPTPSQQEAAGVRKEEIPTVEIYRGLNKEKIPLSK